MYERFYNLKQTPFRLTPDPQFLCMTEQHREALSALIYSVLRRPGLLLLTGEVGMGKTTLLYTLIDFLEKRQHITGLCTNPLLTRQEFFDHLLTTFRVPCSSSLKNQQLDAFRDALVANRKAGRQTVLIVDEAQRLSFELLEEIRLLTNLETPQEKLLQIIMAGQPEFMETLRDPNLRQLKQRINTFCTLKPLSLQEFRDYLQHRLTCAGLPNQQLFSETVLEAIHQYTKGIPRLVNTLCDNALQTGFALRSPNITLSIIEEAAADLDLLNEPIQLEPAPIIGGLKMDAAPTAVLTMASVPVPNLAYERDGNRSASESIPLEAYTARQRSLGFLAGLLDRWK